MKKTLRMVSFAIALLALLQAGSLLAQSAKRRAPKVIQLEEITIEGRVQKPNAFYILNRSNIGYEVMDLRTSFVNKVVGSVDQEQF
jgi:hypothetical protein